MTLKNSSSDARNLPGNLVVTPIIFTSIAPKSPLAPISIIWARLSVEPIDLGLFKSILDTKSPADPVTPNDKADDLKASPIAILAP